MALVIILVFFFQREHYLIVLLLLEVVSIVLVIGIPIVIFSFGIVSSPLFLILLTISACEASLGLRIMVYLVRSYGVDLLKCVSLGSL
jgi:NADH:ubiquinone oxidoreductase subunit K